MKKMYLHDLVNNAQIQETAQRSVQNPKNGTFSETS